MDTLYQIKYRYRTGDSFNTRNDEDTLEFEWKDINLAKDALRRIKEHYIWYHDMEKAYTSRKKDIPRPVWHEEKFGQFDDYNQYLLVFKLDNNNDVQFHAPWCGYFEELYGAEIVVTGDTDMKFEF